MFVVLFVFFFKQKTAYELLRSLVGSEMCIRDSFFPVSGIALLLGVYLVYDAVCYSMPGPAAALAYACLLYTSDAADDLLCVDLGGSRIIKKNKL